MRHGGSVETMQGRLTSHAEECMELYATAAQLKDTEARCIARGTAAAASAEEQATAAMAASNRTAAEQSQSRLDSLRDCMHAELSALKAQVSDCASTGVCASGRPLTVTQCIDPPWWLRAGSGTGGGAMWLSVGVGGGGEDSTGGVCSVSVPQAWVNYLVCA